MDKKLNNDVTIFENEDFGSIRTMLIDDEIYFVGKDVATVLGYERGTKAIVDHIDDEDRIMIDNKTQSYFGIQLGQRGGWLINESGLYSLILSSKLPNAKKFKKWVTSEVLPTIRKTGGYISNSGLLVETYFGTLSENYKVIIKGMFDNIEEQQKTITKQKEEIDVLNNENGLLAEKNLKWTDRNLLNALVRRYAGVIGDFAHSWNAFKQRILYKYSININARISNRQKATGKKTKPKTLDMLNDDEIPYAFSTIVSMCKEVGIDISDLLKNKEHLEVNY